MKTAPVLARRAVGSWVGRGLEEDDADSACRIAGAENRAEVAGIGDRSEGDPAVAILEPEVVEGVPALAHDGREALRAVAVGDGAEDGGGDIETGCVRGGNGGACPLAGEEVGGDDKGLDRSACLDGFEHGADALDVGEGYLSGSGYARGGVALFAAAEGADAVVRGVGDHRSHSSASSINKDGFESSRGAPVSSHLFPDDGFVAGDSTGCDRFSRNAGEWRTVESSGSGSNRLLGVWRFEGVSHVFQD